MKAPAPRKKLLALLVLLACAAALIILYTREPRYNGRSLTSWLQQYAAAPAFDTKQAAEAQNAIRSIGAERSLPILLKLVRAKDSPIDDLVLKMKAKFGLKFLHWRFAALFQSYGLAGFDALGTNAAPAVDPLARLLNDKDWQRAMLGFQCLQKIGKPAEGAFCQCLTNQNQSVRLLSVDELGFVTGDAETYISRVKVCLNDSDISVRVTAVREIGYRYAQVRQQVVPYLVTLLNDPHEDIRMTTSNVLKTLDPQAAADAGIK
jgi:HEAT repeat protein